jgi:hypothetical protein
MPSGKKLSIIRTGKSRTLQEIRVNGKRIEDYFVEHALLADGGVIEIVTE